MKVILLGAGGHAQVIADILLSCIASGENYTITGYLDDDISLKGKTIRGISVLGKFDDLSVMDYDGIIVGVGDNTIRKKIFEKFYSLSSKILTAIHPQSIIASDVIIGHGTVVFPGAIINTGSLIGDNAIINTGATIDHHANIGSHVHIAPGVHLGGTVSVAEGSFLGIGTNVIPNVSIGAWSVVGAGSTVISDVPSHVTAVGTPARIIKHKES